MKRGMAGARARARSMGKGKDMSKGQGEGEGHCERKATLSVTLNLVSPPLPARAAVG